MDKVYCSNNDCGERSIYTLRCARTGESQDVVVCQEHGEHMPLIDDDLVTASPAESGMLCDFYEGRASCTASGCNHGNCEQAAEDEAKREAAEEREHDRLEEQGLDEWRRA